jgi:DNA-binding CsgD family transcriptional regulator/PAS domain-containing protein
MREEELLGLIDRLYEAAVQAKAWMDFVEALEHALGGAAVVVSLRGAESARPGSLVGPSLDPALRRAYEEQYAELDPFVPHLERLAVGSVEFGNDLVPEAELRHSVYYREWMAPQGLLPSPCVVGIIERDWQHGTFAIRIFRRRDTVWASGRVQRLARLLMPHMQRVVTIHREVVKAEANGRGLAWALESIPIAVILIDERGRVCATNRAADRILGRRDGLSLHRHGLQCTHAKETAQLQGLLAEAVRTGLWEIRGEARALTLSRPSGRRPLEALVTAVPGEAMSSGPEIPRAVLFVSDPDSKAEPSIELLQQYYGLTPSEAALACELASGSSLKEAAQHMGISGETARTRIKQVFVKTGSHSQTALARLLLGGVVHLIEPRDPGEAHSGPPSLG